MGSYYWIKLYHEILDDPKMGLLPDRLWRRIIELFLMAGELDQEGELPPLCEMAWRLRIPEADLAADLEQIEALCIVHRTDDTWIVTRFADRQARDSDAERQRRYRERKRKTARYGHADDTSSVTDDVTDSVTTRNTDIDIDIDKEEERESCTTSSDYQVIRLLWSELFPTKPQPRADNKTLQGKLKTRMASAHFRDNWEAALRRAANSTFCRQESWFDLKWFLKNDDNYEACLNGKYDDRHGGTSRRPAQKFVVTPNYHEDTQEEADRANAAAAARLAAQEASHAKDQ